MRPFIFDLDGTLIDSVYAHVLAWQKSFSAEGMQVPAWSIHAKIGLGGKELALAIGRELGKHVSENEADGLDQRHGTIINELLPRAELCREPPRFSAAFAKWIFPGHSDFRRSARGRPSAAHSRPPPDDATVVCKSDVEHAKPEPDLFLACQERLKIPARDCFVVGDAVWDLLAAKRSGMQSIGVLTGGIGRTELTQAGAYRVYSDVAQLDARRYELGLVIS